MTKVFSCICSLFNHWFEYLSFETALIIQMVTMRTYLYTIAISLLFISVCTNAISQIVPADIMFVRQAVKRIIFDEKQAIPIADLDPAKIIGLSSMHPVKNYLPSPADISIANNKLLLKSKMPSETTIWFGGFNPFATYTISLDSCSGKGAVGYAFTNQEGNGDEKFVIVLEFGNSQLRDVRMKISQGLKTITDQSILVGDINLQMKGKIILQMLGSGLTVFFESDGLPAVIAQADFSNHLDVRDKQRINTYQSHLLVKLNDGGIIISRASIAFTTGMGLADIRAITYENGEPIMDEGRVWYTMSIRGRALPHHIQGVFSIHPTVFDLRFEGIILFDRQDGLLRNEIASHIFYDRSAKTWRGITTGFSAYANPDKEKKQLLAVESRQDPRKGFSVMQAGPFGIVGDIEDPHIIFDSKAKKWRILTLSLIHI